MTKPIDDNCRDLFDDVVVKSVLDLLKNESAEAAAALYDLIEDDKTKRFILAESHEGRPVSEVLGRTAPQQTATQEGPADQSVSDFYSDMNALFNPVPADEASEAPAQPADPLRAAVQQSLAGNPVDYPAIIDAIPATQRRRALSRALSDMATDDDIPVEEARRLANSIGERGLKNAVLNSNIPGTATPLIEALRRKAQTPDSQNLSRVFDAQEGGTAAEPNAPMPTPLHEQREIAPTDNDVFPPTTAAQPEAPAEPAFADDFYRNFGQGGHFIVPSFAPPKPVTVSGGKQVPTPDGGSGEGDLDRLRELTTNALAQEESFLEMRRRAAGGDQQAAEGLPQQAQNFRDSVMALTQVDGIHNEVEASAVFLDLKRRKLLSEISELPDGEEKRDKIKQRVEVENALHNLAYGENSPEAERILNAERGAEETDVLIAVNQIEDALNNPREVGVIEQGISENRAKAASVNRLIDQLKASNLTDSSKKQLSDLFEAKRQLNSDYNKLVRERSISAGTADNARLNKLSSEISQIQNRMGEAQDRTPEQAAKDERRLQDLTGELLLRYNNLARSGRAVDLAVEDEDGDRSDRVFAKNAKEMTDRVLSHENNQFNSAEELELLPQRYENSIQDYLSSNGGRAVYQHARLFPNSEMAKVFEFDLVGDDGASRAVARRRYTALQQLLQNPEELNRLGLNNLDRARMEFQKDLYRFNLPREQGGHWKDEAGRIFYRPFEEDPDVIAEADSQTEAMNSLITNSLEKNLSEQDLIQLRSKKISPEAPQGDFLYPKELYSHLTESGQHPRTQYGELYKVFGAIAHVWEDKKQGITEKDNPLVHRASEQILDDVKATENFINRALPEPTNPGELLSRNRRTLGRLSRGVRLPSKDYVDRIDSGETIPRIDIPVDTPQEHVARNYGISWGTARDNFLTRDITGLVDYNNSLNPDLIAAEQAYLNDNPDVDEVRRAAFELDNFLHERLQQNPDAPIQDHQRAVLDFARQTMESDYMKQFMNRWLAPNRREIKKLEEEIAGGQATPGQQRRLDFLRSSLQQKENSAKVRIPQSLLERGEAWLDSDPLFQDIGRAVGNAEEGQMVRYPEERGMLDSKVKENRRRLAQENIIDDIKSFEGSSDKVIGSIKPQYALAPSKRGTPQSSDTLAQLLDVERQQLPYEEARLHPTWQLTPYMEYQNSPELVSEINQYLNNLSEKTRIEGSAGGRRLLWDRAANALQAKLLLKENRDRALSLLDRNNNRDFDRFIDRLARQALDEQYGTDRIEGTMPSENALAARDVYADRLTPGEDHRFYNEKTMEGMGVQKPALKYEKPLAPSLFEAAGQEAPENRYEELVQNLKDRSRVLLRGTPNEASLPEMAAAQDLTNLILATEDRDNLVVEPRSPLGSLRSASPGATVAPDETPLDASSIDPSISPEEGRDIIQQAVDTSNPAEAFKLLSDDVVADLADLRAKPGRTAALQEGRKKKMEELETPEEYVPFRQRLDYFADGLAESLVQSSPERAAQLANQPDALEQTLLDRVTDRATDEAQAGRPGLQNFWEGRSDEQKVALIRELASRYRVRTLPKDELSPADDAAAERIVEQEKFAGLQIDADPSKARSMKILADSVERARQGQELPESTPNPGGGEGFGRKGLEFLTGLAEAFYGSGGGGGGAGGGGGGATPPQPPKPPTNPPAQQTPTEAGQVAGQTAAGELNEINQARQLLRSIQAGVPAGTLVIDPRLARQVTDVLNNSLPKSARGRTTYLSKLQDSLIDAIDSIEQKQAALPDDAQKKNALAALMKQRRMAEMVLRLISGLF